MYLIKKIIFVYFVSRILKYDKNLSFVDLNFKEIDFTNYGQIKNFIFKKIFII